MKAISMLVGGLLSASATVAASGKYVKLNFDKSLGKTLEDSSLGGSLQKRHEQGYSLIDVFNEQSFYSVELKIGSPSQKVTVLIDTGSSDLWIMGSDNPLCKANSKEVAGLSLNKRNGNSGKATTTTAAATAAAAELASASTDKAGNVIRLDDPFGIMSALDSMESALGNGGNGYYTTIEETMPAGDGTYNTGEATETSSPSSDDGDDDGTSSSSPSSTSDSIDCNQYGTFNKEKSSSFHSNDTSFEISYGDNSYASGVWGMDVLNVDGVNVTGVSFAVANYSNSTVGVLGIGLAGLETTYSGSGSTSSGGDTLQSYEYNNLPMVMKQNNIIDYIAYSLYLNDPDSKQGSVLFGAVDHSKYSGNLYTVPMVNIYAKQGISKPIEFDVTMYGIGVTTGTDNLTIATTKIPALLDSGTTIAYFPDDLLRLVASTLGAKYDNSLGFYTMDCPSSSSSDSANTKLVFDFGGFHITAPLSDFLMSQGAGTCVLTISSQNEERIVLGDVFLQHAYVVYDLEKLEISMAQATFDSNSSQDEENDSNIGVIVTGVPSAIRAVSFDDIWSTDVPITSGGDIFTITNADASFSGSATATNSNGSGSGTQTATRSNSNVNARSTSASGSQDSASSSSSSNGGSEEERSSTASSDKTSNGAIPQLSLSYIQSSFMALVLSFLV